MKECSGAWEAVSIHNERESVIFYRGEKGGEAQQKSLSMLQ